MNELLDQNISHARNRGSGYKELNTVLVVLSVVIVLFACAKVWITKNTMTSPWLPEYTAYYINGALINYSVIQIGGLIPAFYLRIRKHYFVSSMCLIAFILAATILKNSLNIYTYF